MIKDLSKFKKILEGEKIKLQKDIAEAEKPEDFGSDVDDFDEEKNEAESFGNKLGIASALKERMNDIDASLQKISSGAYGMCEKCGKNIEEEVLRISPESRLCKNCKRDS